MSAGRIGVGAVAELMSLARQVADRAAAPAEHSDDASGAAAELPTGSTSAGPPSATGELTTTMIGAAFEAADLTRDAAALAWRASAPARSMLGWMAQAPPARPIADRVTETVDRWQQRGELETAAGRTEVRGLAQAAVDELADSTTVPDVAIEVVQGMLPAIVDRALPDLLDSALPGVMATLQKDPSTINGLVDSLLPDLLPGVMAKIADDPKPIMDLVNGIIGPLLDELLPQVIDQMGENPEPIRELVMGQSTSIAGDMVESVRARAVTGDERAERIVRKLLLRKQRPELVPTPTAVPELGTGTGAPTEQPASRTADGSGPDGTPAP